jgi:sigma-E factor negative regulatory protein RseC
MDEIGVVKSTNGIMAIVSVKRTSACEQCSGGCAITDSGADLEAINRAKAVTGQRVRVALRPYSYLRGSIVVYGLPALALIVGAVAGKEFFSGLFSSLDPDIVSALFGFGAFTLAFILVKIWGVRVAKETAYKPVIEEILKEQEKEEPFIAPEDH